MYRNAVRAREVVIVKVVPEMRWQLPKGVIDEGETNEEAALREVREEAGVDAKIVELIETSEYWFTAERDGEMRRYHKFVHFFLMEYLGGNVEDHDHEVAEARWVTVEDAIRMLAFKSERDIVAKGSAMLEESLV